MHKHVPLPNVVRPLCVVKPRPAAVKCGRVVQQHVEAQHRSVTMRPDAVLRARWQRTKGDEEAKEEHKTVS